MLTGILILDQAFTSPLVLGYAIMVVASGLWFRVELVWFTTAIAAAGYGVLLWVALGQGKLGESPHHHVIVMLTLALLGMMVAAQVKRVRALSRYYDSRPLP
jgi:hypothetical protein